jgi:cytochrome P450
LFGSVLSSSQSDPLTFFTECTRRYGDVIGLRYLHYRGMFLNHPDLIEEVLVNQADAFHKGRVLRGQKRLFGNGLLTSEGNLWLRQRRLAQPAFHRARIAGYAEVMTSFTNRMLDGWRGGETRDLHEEMTRLTLQIVARTLFGTDVADDTREVAAIVTMLLELGADFRGVMLVPAWLPTPDNVRGYFAIRRLNRVVYRILAERLAGNRDTGDLLSMLLAARDDDGSRMSDRQLRDEVITLFLAGHETTANALAWTWLLLAQNPSVEARLHSELESVLCGRTASADDLASLPYLHNVLSESLRLYPPAWGMARLAVKEVRLGGYRVKKGTGISFSQWVVQRDPRWFDAPLEFRPERWEDGLARRLPRFAYFPFGGGPRQCIGNAFALMEAALILSTVAQRFRFELEPSHKVEPLASITLRPRNGIRAILHERCAKSAQQVSAPPETCPAQSASESRARSNRA